MDVARRADRARPALPRRVRPGDARRHRRLVGPARADFAAALDALEPLRRFRDENGRELLDVPRAPLPAADTPAPVRFLPKWDNTLLAHADRRRVLPEELRKTVIAKNGDVTQTFLVDGVVAGSWSADKKGKVDDRAVRASPPRRAPRGRGRGGTTRSAGSR